uniref:Uncharacterized protein n=1 Tax=Arundo donax TaxID=35708 RepID=A0A0A9EB08_ARUDO
MGYEGITLTIYACMKSLWKSHQVDHIKPIPEPFKMTLFPQCELLRK